MAAKLEEVRTLKSRSQRNDGKQTFEVQRGLSFSGGSFPTMRAVPWSMDRDVIISADVTQSGKAAED